MVTLGKGAQHLHPTKEDAEVQGDCGGLVSTAQFFYEQVFVLFSFPFRGRLSGAIRIGRVGIAVEPGSLFLLMCFFVLLTWLTVHFTLIQLSLPNALLTPASLTS